MTNLRSLNLSAVGKIAHKADIICSLVSLLSLSKGTEAEWAACTLLNIACGDAACKVACVELGVIPALGKLLSRRKGAEAEHAAAALEGIVWDNAAGGAACVSAGAVPLLVKMLSSRKGDEAEQAACALRSISSGDAACKVACVEAGALPHLVSLWLLRHQPWIAIPAKASLTNIANHSPEYRQLVIDAGFNPPK